MSAVVAQESRLFADVVAPILATARRSGWTTSTGDEWTHVSPPIALQRLQGWKLHVSSSLPDAGALLEACCSVLIPHLTQFKFAATSQNLQFLNGRQCPRPNAAKFITVYPADDDTGAQLAELLHKVTREFHGPKIFSDREYVPGSRVFYRFGAFSGMSILSNDATYVNCVVDPTGRPVEDRRTATFRPPPWAPPSPFPIRPIAGSTAADRPVHAGDSVPDAVILANRYEITTALRHSAKGGVYLGVDLATDAEIVLKEARPHVSEDHHTSSAIDLLRHERRVLDHVADLGIGPAVLDGFTQEQHEFLVLERIVGDTLRQRAGRAQTSVQDVARQADVVDACGRLAEILKRLHDRGVVVRDLSPNNIIIEADGVLRLIDFEIAAIADDYSGLLYLCPRAGTPGFCPPEQFAGAVPDLAVDAYGLGAVCYYLATGAPPPSVSADEDGRSFEARIAAHLRPPLAPVTIRPETIALCEGLLRIDPTRRLTLDDAAIVIRSGGGLAPAWPLADDVASGAERCSTETPDEQADALIDGILQHLSEGAGSTARSLWPETAFGETVEQCTVQHGVAGAAAVLARLVRSPASTLAEPLLEKTVARMTAHCATTRHELPGMYFGFAGTAWALFEASKALDAPRLLAQSVELVSALPTSWPNADITHGTSGLGSALLHLAEQTDDRRLRQRAEACADDVADRVLRTGRDRSWRVPDTFDSRLAGYSSLGFAHGTAGIGAFLLAVGTRLGREDLVDLAVECGDTLLRSAIRLGETASWPATTDSTKDLHEAAGLYHWCNGASGVGTFLVRLYSVTHEERYLNAAYAAARALMAARWTSSNCYCHGLAGDGDFLLDLAHVTGDPAVVSWVRDIVALLWARRVYDNGRPVLTDESGRQITGGYGAGLAGCLSFLSRVRDGGSRLFHPCPPGFGEEGRSGGAA